LLKETAPPQQTTNLTQKTHSSNGSTLLNENNTPTVDHESNWTVKSTIVTAYTQGAGDFAEPTVISKSVTQSSASSSHDVPVITTIKQNKDSSDLSTNKMTGNGTKVHGTTHPTTATSHGNRVNK